MGDEIEFQVNGKPMRLTREAVEEAVAGVVAERIQTHAVEIRGKRFPVKQVFELATGLDRLDFTSSVARRNLDRLGFQVIRQADERGPSR